MVDSSFNKTILFYLVVINLQILESIGWIRVEVKEKGVKEGS